MKTLTQARRVLSFAVCWLSMSGLLSTSIAQAAQTLNFADGFDYANWTAMNAIWSRETAANNSTGTPTLVTDNSPSPIYSSSYVRFTSGTVINANLNATLTTDFSVSLSVNVPDAEAGRILWVALVDDSGQGYGFSWYSLTKDDGHGTVYINKYTDLSPAYNASDSGRLANASINYTDTFTPATLSWSAATSTLKLSIGGTVVLNFADTTFSNFSKIYIGGNNHVTFDSLSVTGSLSNIPEPSTSAIFIVLLALGFASWRYRRK